jgi:hypothetical protein
MVRAVNLVVSCSNRKRHETAPGLTASELDGSDMQKRLRIWMGRLRTAKAEEYPAENLYMGEHWSVVRTIPQDVMDRGWKVRLWICSAGYGLIQPSTRIKPYQAAFSPAAKDYVARGSIGHSAVQSWWAGVCSYAFSGEENFPRSLLALARAFPRTPLIVALSADYLSAVGADLLGVLQHDFFKHHLSIISCGTRGGDHHLNDNLLPCDGRLAANLGGTLTSLNARVARCLFRFQADAEPSVDHLAALIRSIEIRTKAPAPRAQQADVEVVRFIQERLKKTPLASKTRLLEEFRASGKACEQKRFGELYMQSRRGAQPELYG